MKNLFYTSPKYLQNLKGLESSASSIDGSVENSYPKGGMTIKEPSNYGHLLRIPTDENSAYREHLEPSGWIDTGTTCKQDYMFDPYETSNINYRIYNNFTKHNTDGANYTNGSACVAAKSAGAHNFGLYPAIQFGHQDCSATATPMTLYYFDTADTEWRSGQLGMWREGKLLEANKHVLYNGKMYKCEASGIAGANPPVHLIGTVSDGNINLTFIRDFLTNGVIRPCVLIGDRDTLPVFGLPDVRLQLAGDTAVQYGKKIHFLDQNKYKTTFQAAANKVLNVLNDAGTITMTVDHTLNRLDLKTLELMIRGDIRFTAIASSASSVNSLFLDSADNKLKFKDSTGVVNPLY